MSGALRSRFLSIMKREMSSRDFHPTSYSEYQFEKIVGQGVERMRTSNVVDNMGKVIQAEQNLRRLIDYFCNYSQEAGSYPTLDNEAFDSALRDCPPHWPFRL